jgi:hypothetical protein
MFFVSLKINQNVLLVIHYYISWHPVYISWHPVYIGHITVHVSNQPISDKPTKSWGIKTKHMLRAVVLLVIILIFLHLIGHPKMNERLLSMIPYRMLLDVSISPLFLNRYNKYLVAEILTIMLFLINQIT